MAWTAPATATVGQVLTAAFMNAQLRDNMLLTVPSIVTTDGDIGVATAANAVERWPLLTATTRFVKHEYGGNEFDQSAVTTNDVIGGASAGLMEIKTPVTQAEAEAGSNTRFSLWSSLRVKQAIDALAVLPQGAKFWVTLGMDAVADDSHNLASVDDDGTGRFGLNFTTDFAAATYAYTLGIHAGTSNIFRTALAVTAKVVGSIDVGINDDSDLAVEANVVTVSVACYGALV